jgi:hypothetical protein
MHCSLAPASPHVQGSQYPNPHSGYQHVNELYSLHILNAPTLGIHVKKASTIHKVIDSEPAGISCS